MKSPKIFFFNKSERQPLSGSSSMTLDDPVRKSSAVTHVLTVQITKATKPNGMLCESYNEMHNVALNIAKGILAEMEYDFYQINLQAD